MNLRVADEFSLKLVYSVFDVLLIRKKYYKINKIFKCWNVNGNFKKISYFFHYSTSFKWNITESERRETSTVAALRFNLAVLHAARVINKLGDWKTDTEQVLCSRQQLRSGIRKLTMDYISPYVLHFFALEKLNKIWFKAVITGYRRNNI